MKTVTLSSMRLYNFKGVRDQKISFDPNVTSIYGNNETGKTTLFDAFTWCLFGKDSSGKSDSNFAIKTLDKFGEVIPKIDHEVELVLLVDGKTVVLKRLFQEKWVKKRGFETPEFSGHSTTFYWNDVPLKKNEYELKIRDILDESVFKMITDPHAFTGMHWERQREILISIAGDVSDVDVVAREARFAMILDKLEGKSIKEIRDELAAKRRKVNDELKNIPVRIDEASRTIPNHPKGYFEELEEKAETLEEEIKRLEEKKKNTVSRSDAQAEAIEAYETAISSCRRRQQEIIDDLVAAEARKQRKLEDELLALGREKHEKQTEKNKLYSELSTLGKRLENKREMKRLTAVEADRLREKYDKLQGSSVEVSADKLKCPTCQREYDDADARREEILTDLNTSKANALKKMNQDGLKLVDDEKYFDGQIKSIETDIKKGEGKLEVIEANIIDIDGKILQKEALKVDYIAEGKKIAEKSEEYQRLEENIVADKRNLEVARNTDADLESLTAPIDEKRRELNAVTVKLSERQRIQESENRIAELEDKEKTLAKEMSSYEKDLFLVDEFIATKTQMLQDQVNKKFKLVNFKMFEKQINGGLLPTCKATFKGVDIADVNNAGQIQAGIDIIETLCNHYGVFAPIFIDNAESITKIPQTTSQQVHLVVSEDHPELTVLN